MELIILNPKDNVGVLKSEYNGVPMGHKLALCDIKAGQHVIKYGYSIGVATADIKAGEHVHSHNLQSALTAEGLDYCYNKRKVEVPAVPQRNKAMLFKRENGALGVRNELWIVPTVGCIAGSAEKIAAAFRQRHAGDMKVDDVVVLTHRVGCSELGDDAVRTRQILANLSQNGNVGGALFLGLGCEENQMDGVKAVLPDSPRMRFLIAQQVADEVAAGLEMLEELYAVAAADKRTLQPINGLTVGVKCGGSDGLSGITANYVIGRVADRLEACGACVVLAETPEVFGAEQTLMERAESEEVFGQIAALVNKWKGYYAAHCVNVYENPSPGNKRGGITTLEEKSLGCVQKSGTGEVHAVLTELQRAECGLNVIESPGNDIIACTTLAASGCNLIMFSTGRGTPLGSVVPTLKVSTNTPLAKLKGGWIDYNCGETVFDQSMEECIDGLYNLLLDVAEGKRTCNEINGDKQIALLKTGVTL